MTTIPQNSNIVLSHLHELSLFQTSKIKTDSDSLNHYGKDWTTYFDIQASAILFPESSSEVQEIVKWAVKHQISLIPSGGRTGLSGAAVACHNEVVISFEKMNRILDFNEIDSIVTIQPGVITESLQQFAESKNLYYPVDFAARGSSQMGGNIATNAGGIKVIRYGLTRDWVMGLKVVTGTGEILELNNSLVKNATGPDLRHLFIGSEGIFGFIVEAEIKLAPPPPELQVLILGVPALDKVMEVYSKFKKSTKLVAFEMFSELALQKVLENTHLPRPFETVTPFYILAEIEAGDEISKNNILSTFELCMENEIVVDGALSQSPQQAKNFWRLREDISESLAKYSPYKNDISVRISKVPAFMNELDQVLKTAYPNWEVVWFGHIGDGNLHINILRPTGMKKEEFVQECRKVDLMIFQSVKNQKGSISAEHGVGLTKKSFLNYTRSESEIRILKEIKKTFDPFNIINPGKVIDK